MRRKLYRTDAGDHKRKENTTALQRSLFHRRRQADFQDAADRHGIPAKNIAPMQTNLRVPGNDPHGDHAAAQLGDHHAPGGPHRADCRNAHAKNKQIRKSDRQQIAKGADIKSGLGLGQPPQHRVADHHQQIYRRDQEQHFQHFSGKCHDSRFRANQQKQAFGADIADDGQHDPKQQADQ